MEEKLNLITYFTKDEIEQIHSYLVEFAIRNYEKNQVMYNGFGKEKYEYAKTLRKNQKEINLSLEEIEAFLIDKQEKYNNNLEINKNIIDSFSPIPIWLLQKYSKNLTTEQEILNYIFDFVTSYITYSEDYYKYIIKTPPTKGFDFDFKNLTPVNKDISGLLVQKQGVCDEIANLICYLGKSFGIKIEKEFCRYNDYSHAINYVVVGTNITYIDATRKIRGQKEKNECFLVSKDELNKNNEYEFRNNNTTATINNSNFKPAYDIKKIIDEINTYLPNTIYQEYKKESEKQV